MARAIAVIPGLVFALAIGVAGCFEKNEDKKLKFDKNAVGDLLKNYKQHEKHYSQVNEEFIIRDFFRDRRDGVFLDVGCADALHFSTTAYLEKHLGWSGIGVDALSEWAPGYAQHRPRTKFHNYLVTNASGAKTTFYRSREPTLSSIKEYRVKKFGKFTEMVVESITLDDLLAKEGVAKLDFVSIDIEDAEPEALEGFDIQRFQPELVCIEAHKPVRQAILAYFRKHGYERIEVYRKYDWPGSKIGELNWYFTTEKIARERFKQRR